MLQKRDISERGTVDSGKNASWNRGNPQDHSCFTCNLEESISLHQAEVCNSTTTHPAKPSARPLLGGGGAPPRRAAAHSPGAAARSPGAARSPAPGGRGAPGPAPRVGVDHAAGSTADTPEARSPAHGFRQGVGDRAGDRKEEGPPVGSLADGNDARRAWHESELVSRLGFLNTS